MNSPNSETRLNFAICTQTTVNDVWHNLEKNGLSREYFYITQNGRLMYDDDLVMGNIRICPRLLGGKGGFGSMLRAIGAQIEKTTNREACRDLSGRRLRDINEEKRLKAWIEKQAHREEEAAERKKKKLERLCAEPKYEFKDDHYETERRVLGEKIDSSVEAGFKITITSTSQPSTSSKIKGKGIKRKTIMDDDEDIDSDELSSSEDECDNNTEKKKLKATSDNECTSSDSEKKSLENNSDSDSRGSNSEIDEIKKNSNDENSCSDSTTKGIKNNSDDECTSSSR